MTSSVGHLPWDIVSQATQKSELTVMKWFLSISHKATQRLNAEKRNFSFTALQTCITKLFFLLNHWENCQSGWAQIEERADSSASRTRAKKTKHLLNCFFSSSPFLHFCNYSLSQSVRQISIQNVGRQVFFLFFFHRDPASAMYCCNNILMMM